jgi:hypothetical protein
LANGQRQGLQREEPMSQASAGILPWRAQEVKNEYLSDEKVCIAPVGTNGTPYLSLLSKRSRVV